MSGEANPFMLIILFYIFVGDNIPLPPIDQQKFNLAEIQGTRNFEV